MSRVSPNCLQAVFHLALLHIPMLQDYLHYIRKFFHFLKATIIFGWIPKKYVEEGYVRLWHIGRRTDTRQIALFYTIVIVLMTSQMQSIQIPNQTTQFLWKTVGFFPEYVTLWDWYDWRCTSHRMASWHRQW